MRKNKKKSHKKFAELAKILGRSNQSVRLRYELLKKRKDPEEKRKFLLNIESVIK